MGSPSGPEKKMYNFHFIISKEQILCGKNANGIVYFILQIREERKKVI
jgi:hypothetical protein